MNKYVLALALCAIAAPASAQVVNPALRVQPQMVQRAPVVDPAVAELSKAVKALEQENVALKAQLAKQDASIGQLLTQILAQKQTINGLHSSVGDLQSGLGDLQTKFASHQHTYQRANLTKTNVQVVKDTGGLTSPEVVGWATYINDFWTYGEKTSGPQ